VKDKLLQTDSSNLETKLRLIFYLTQKLELAEEKRTLSKAEEENEDSFTLTFHELEYDFKRYFFQNE
jgi:hypothetical protein